MGNLEQFGEIKQKVETKMTPEMEVERLNGDLIQGTQEIFANNHELVKEAMFGMGSRKAKEVLEDLSKCREATKKAVKNFQEVKEKCFPNPAHRFYADSYHEDRQKAV